MPFDQALRLTSILLASASFIGLMVGTGLPEWLAALTGMALIVVLLRSVGISSVDHLVMRVPISATGWNLVVIGGFLGFWVDLLWVSEELLPAGIHFLMLLMVIKLFNLKFRRDYLHLYAISLVAILASGSLTTDLWFFPIFTLYLLAGVWTLLLFQLTKSSEATGSFTIPRTIPHDAQDGFDRVTPHLFWIGNGLAIGAFLMTLVIFFTIPRLSAGFYQKGVGENLRTSGFSDTVNLGAIGPIKRAPSIVMRVELSGRPLRNGGPLYIRGVSFDRYDGKAWTNRLSHRRSLREETAGTFVLRGKRSTVSLQSGETIQQKILLEPLDTPVLFAAPFVESVSGPFPNLLSDVTGSVYLPFPSASRIEYTVVSRSTPLVPADFSSEAGLYPESFASYFLQIPHESERVGALARELTHATRGAYEKVNAIQIYLTHNYRYSLDAPLAEQDHPLEEFLFTRKTGYCEHYATAMVILLRMVGIPARLVTGFLATEWNEYGNYYVVRQQDAHAWVEVHLPHSGWIPMDPTPPILEGAGDGNPAWTVLGRVLDNVRLQWNRFFVQYSAADQFAVVQELKAGSTSVRNKALDSMTSLVSAFTAILGGIITQDVSRVRIGFLGKTFGSVLIGLAVLLWLGMRQPWAGRSPGEKRSRQDQAMANLYGRMLTYLSRQGIAKPTAMAPIEFVGIIRARWSAANAHVASITGLYCQARFGHIPLTQEELQRANDDLHRLMSLQKL